MKKNKGLLIAGAIGFVSVASLFAFRPEPGNTGIVSQAQGGSVVPTATGTGFVSGVTATTKADKRSLKEELESKNITPERRKEIRQKLKDLKNK